MHAADRLLTDLLNCEDDASGINFTPGRFPQIEVYGELHTVEVEGLGDCLTPQHTAHLAETMMGEAAELQPRLESEGSCDCAYTLPNDTRLRVNIFKVNQALSIVIRVVSHEIPSLGELGIPAGVQEAAKLNSGLVLVTGNTGSGKSTTLAAIVAEINKTRPVHIITLEDPVEFVHAHAKATVNQREFGNDFTCFREGLRAALRQAPHVIMLGEMRDRESIEIALKAAETGHLVLSTLHTLDTGRTISRITGMFGNTDVPFIRMRLSETLRFIVGQRLLPREDRPGRVVAAEVMTSTLQTRELIRVGESDQKTFCQVLGEGKSYGMQTFDQHILELYERGIITEDTARGYSSEAASVLQEIDKLRTKRGEETSDLGELELAHKVETRRPNRRTNPYKSGGNSWQSSASRTNR